MKTLFALISVMLASLASPIFAQPYQCSTLGEQRLLVFNVNGKTTVAQAQVAFFGPASNSLDQFFRYSSYGQTWFTGDIVNVTIQEPSTCDPITVHDRANAAAVGKGVNLDLYTRRIYVGGVNTCYWMGSVWAFWPNNTSVGGTTYTTLWLNGLGAWNHEMGHCFGSTHVDGMDPTDVMADLSSPFNAPHRVQFNWLQTIQNVTAGGTYLISTLENKVFTPQVLRIQKSANEWYWLSYRQEPMFSARLNAGV
ncbi:MAG TPA: hypothetical protein VMX97_03100, partial [Hyphomicrobiaceae bacterium]|nr:hypothetical protein [Hyphomicrobiaceae bacterium]